MTVPHLMNCPHTNDGWCAQCVAELGNENLRLRAALDKCRDIMVTLTALADSQINSGVPLAHLDAKVWSILMGHNINF